VLKIYTLNGEDNQMVDYRIQNLAKILVHYCTGVRHGDKAIIRGFPLEPVATPLVQEVYRQVLQAGGHPHLLVNLQDLDYIFLTEAAEHQLVYVNPFRKMVAEEFDVDYRIGSATNTRHLTNINPQAMRAMRNAYADVSDTLMKRGGTEELRWVVTRYPTDAYAQDAEMSLLEFEDFFYGSTFADVDDPISKWKEVHHRQQRFVDWLEGKKNVRLVGSNIELELSVESREFINCSGRNNMPDGEIFTGPVEDSLNGWVRYSYPCIWAGVAVEGAELVFEEGKVVEAKAEKNEEFLMGALKTDLGASYVGEFGIGTNKRIDRFTGNMLFDEKIHGTIHLALGGGYPETGSQNKSAIHWDMLCDMHEGQIFVDGEPFYQNGEFLI
jgi:aminopeptidase